MHVSGLGDLAIADFGVHEVDDESAAVLLEALGEMYGTMGYAAAPSFGMPYDDDAIMAGALGVADFGPPLDDDIEELEGLGDFGDAAPRNMSQRQWERIGKGLRGKIRKYAGKNAPRKCPSGYTRTKGPQYAEERGRGRWICGRPQGFNRGYVIWNRKARKWDKRLLHCPARRGWKRATNVRCKRVKKRGFFKRVAKGIEKGAKKIGKIAIAPYKFVLKLQLKILMKAAMPLAKALCKMPVALVQAGALAAGMDPATSLQKRNLFCRAIKVRNVRDIRKFFPDMLKMGIKIAATTSVPGLGPALMIAKAIPGLNKVISFAGPGGMGDPDPIELLDSMTHGQIYGALGAVSDVELLDGLGAWDRSDTARAVAAGGLVVAAGAALYAVARDRRY